MKLYHFNIKIQFHRSLSERRMICDVKRREQNNIHARNQKDTISLSPLGLLLQSYNDAPQSRYGTSFAVHQWTQGQVHQWGMKIVRPISVIPVILKER